MNEIDLATKSLSWIVAPLGILVAAWMFAVLYVAIIRSLMDAVKSFCEARRIHRECQKLEATASHPTGQTSQQLVWLRRDRDRCQAETLEDVRNAGLQFVKSTVPFLAILGFGVLLATPWNPASSPVTYLSGILSPDTPADTSLEFIADAGLRFQSKIADLETQITALRAERDAATAQLAALKTAVANPGLTASQRRALAAAPERPDDSTRPAPPPITTTGAPAISTTYSAFTPQASTPAPPPPPRRSDKVARSREILTELTARWASCANELETLSTRGPGGAKFSNWVQPRLLSLLRSETEKETSTNLRELLAAFDTDKPIVAASPTFTRVDQLLRQLEILIFGLPPTPASAQR